MWLRRSRLVAREFRTRAPWTQELFAPASTLGIIHEVISVALAEGLELVTLDVRDAYLNVPQKTPVVIMVDASLFGGGAASTSQRIAAAEWFECFKGMLVEGDLENFCKEPSLFRAKGPDGDTAMILHADDGLLASTKAAREKLIGALSTKVEEGERSPPCRGG